MCHYSDVLGDAGALPIQLLTVASIAFSIVFWVLVYRREEVGLRQYALPIILWVAFGTLDIIITARGTIGNPMREGNPLARYVFIEAGWIGPVVASVLWIALWAGAVLVANKLLKAPHAAYVSLAVFYSLAIGHVFGFSSWFGPLCAISKFSWEVLADYPARFFGIVAIGCVLGAAHFFAARRFGARPGLQHI